MSRDLSLEGREGLRGGPQGMRGGSGVQEGSERGGNCLLGAWRATGQRHAKPSNTTSLAWSTGLGSLAPIIVTGA